MIFRQHYNLNGTHAFLSASKYSWVRYDMDQLETAWQTSQAAKRGDELHAFAAQAIRLGIKLKGIAATLNLYVNDAIGYRMTPEQILFFSENAYGCADAISFRKERGKWVLRIHDLKTGISPASMDQLYVYAAFFFLEYQRQIEVSPFDVVMEFRIYQNDDFIYEIGDPDKVIHFMEQAKLFDRWITERKREELGFGIN